MKILNGAIKYFLVVLMLLISILTFLQVVMRYGFNNALSWSEELVRFLFVWASFMGAAIGVKEYIHIGIDVVVNMLPAGIRRITNTVVYLLIIAFGVFMTTAGWSVVQLTHGQTSPALKLPMSYVYAAVPLMGVLLVLYSALEIWKVWMPKPVPEAEQ